MPRQLVLNPSVPEPTPYGLLTVASFPDNSDVHWQGGITFQSICVTGQGGTFFDPCVSPFTSGGSSTDPGSFQPTDQRNLRGATPFDTYVEIDCSPVGFTPDDAQQLATQRLGIATPFQAERAFWTGQAGGTPVGAGQGIVYPHLAHAGAVISDTSFTQPVQMQSAPVTGGSATTDVAEALGFLEDGLARCLGGSGVIHVPTIALPTLDAWGLVKVQGQTLRTLNGNRVAVGAGYPGTGPNGATPAVGTTWMFATGPVFGFLGNIRVGNGPDSMDRSKNTLKMIAQRAVLLGWDCCHFGVLTQLGVPPT